MIRLLRKLLARMGVVFRLPHGVRYDSAEFACLHEAGHVAAALLVGARVAEVQLYIEAPRSYGRTRCERDDEQRRLIALGGFAIERRLWEMGRLLLPDGSTPNEQDMLDRSARNAADDRLSYFGGDYRGENRFWPREMDLDFMTRARNLGQRIDFELVEQLAAALFAEEFLDEGRIRSIVGRSR